MTYYQGEAVSAETSIPMDPGAFASDVFEDSNYDIAMENEAVFTSARNLSARDYIDVEGIVALTARLSQLLAEEVGLLKSMQIKELEGLQKEKLQLLDALEAQKRHIDSNPELLNYLTDDQCLELAQIIEIFQGVMRENHQRLLIAREVNLKVTEAIVEAVSESSANGQYGRSGNTKKSNASISMTVDKTI